jgi:hypothetical protein
LARATIDVTPGGGVSSGEQWTIVVLVQQNLSGGDWDSGNGIVT